VSLQQCKEAHYFERNQLEDIYRSLRMPEGVVEKQPERAAVWAFQEAEVVGGGEVDGFNSRAEICALRSQTHSFSTPPHLRNESHYKSYKAAGDRMESA
jgi:hypothetical protein